jgi:ATP-dependent Clp protease ATP-binding subunit ClpC
MSTRFTDRARNVIQLARHEAQRFNHEYVGTEHILFGLLSEGQGFATQVLKNLGIDLASVRTNVERITQTGPGGQQIARGKLPFTPLGKKAIESAVEEARDLNDDFLGTGHLLLGLLRQGEGVAYQILTTHGVLIEKARCQVQVEQANAPVVDGRVDDVAPDLTKLLSGEQESSPSKKKSWRIWH